jgi:cation transport ATPase
MDDEYEESEYESPEGSWEYEDSEKWLEDEDEDLERRTKSSRLLKFFILLFFIVPFVMVGISVIFILTEFELSHKLWLSGFVTIVAALISYIIYAYGTKLEMAQIPAVVLFALGIVMFYMAMWFMPTTPETEGKRIVGIAIITIILVIILFLLIYLLVRKVRKDKPQTHERRLPVRRKRPPMRVMQKKRY